MKKNVKVLGIIIISYLTILPLPASAVKKSSNGSTGELLNPSKNAEVNRIEYGEWLPLRMKPVTSTSFSQAAGKISKHNTDCVRKIIDALSVKKDMLLIRGKFGRLLVDSTDGLIKGMRPAVMSSSFQGSYLCEKGDIPKAGKGSLKVLKKDGAIIEIEWKNKISSRQILINADTGDIKSSWVNGPSNFSLFTSILPYENLSVNNEMVRFDQLIEQKRKLSKCKKLALSGYRNSVLEIAARGIFADSEEVWLEPGEISWVWAMNYLKEKKIKDNNHLYIPFGEWMRKNAAFVYPGGGAVRKLDFKAETKDWKINYMISEAGVKSFASPVKKKAVNVSVKNASLHTVRLWPNKFNGWKLRPLKWVQINPIPRYYSITVENNSTEKQTISFSMKKLQWLRSASIEYDPIEYKLKNGSSAYRLPSVFEYKGKDILGKEHSFVKLEAGESKNILLQIQPIEESEGKYNFNLNCKTKDEAYEIPLELYVDISGMVSPMAFYPFVDNEDSRYFSYTHYTVHPAYFEWYWSGISIEEQDKYLKLMGKRTLKDGFWTFDNGYLRKYITAYTQNGKGASGRQKKYFSMPPEKYAQNIRRDVVMRKSRIPSRFRVYLYDEIYEILGGYNGHKFMPVPEVAKLSEAIIEGCPTPCYPSFMASGVDSLYQVKLPNDIADMFYYSGKDTMLRVYADKLVRTRLELVEKWKKDPEIMKKAGDDEIKTLFSFWISAQLHVTDYNAMRRQFWFLRKLGYESISCWSMRYSDLLYSRDTIGNNATILCGKQIMMTDRALAWYDIRKDMALTAQVRFYKEKTDSKTAGQVSALEEKAYEYSQKNRFSHARQMLYQALSLMGKNDSGSDRFQKISPEPLPDLLEKEKAFNEDGSSKARKTANISKLIEKFRPAPTLNATTDNAYIEEGAVFNEFSLLNTYKKAQAETTVYAAWNDKYLYVLFLCMEPYIDKLKTKPGIKRDSTKIFKNDTVEIFIDNFFDGYSYMQFVADPSGNLYDARTIIKDIYGNKVPQTEVGWNPDCKVKTMVSDKCWSAEFHIPMSAIGGPPKPGSKWRINFGRERKPVKEDSMWSPQYGGFGYPTQFGELNFRKQEVKNL